MKEKEIRLNADKRKSLSIDFRRHCEDQDSHEKEAFFQAREYCNEVIPQAFATMKEAEEFYLKGLQLDAGHLGINEYLGELYVQTNRLELAKERLKVLYGCNCEEYEELKEIIENN